MIVRVWSVWLGFQDSVLQGGFQEVGSGEAGFGFFKFDSVCIALGWFELGQDGFR